MKKYNIIYADPPWQYDNATPPQGAITYPTMSLRDIKNLPVSDIAADDSVLFLWATMPMLQEGLDVVDSWGFKYRTVAFVWVKRYNDTSLYCGLGHWTRANAEIVLFGRRGNPTRERSDVRQIVEAVRGEHSAKPPEVRDRIVQLMGDLPRIELFARRPEPSLFGDTMAGWDVWGNEVESDIEL